MIQCEQVGQQSVTEKPLWDPSSVNAPEHKVIKKKLVIITALTLMVHARTSSGPAVKKYSSCSAAQPVFIIFVRTLETHREAMMEQFQEAVHDIHATCCVNVPPLCLVFLAVLSPLLLVHVKQLSLDTSTHRNHHSARVVSVYPLLDFCQPEKKQAAGLIILKV